jgi:uncharacterized membrane protein
MTLDHVRDFFTDAHYDPTDLSMTTLAAFATRWVTHICAPAFFLLAGVGAYLCRVHCRPPSPSLYLLIRGLWLVMLELTLVRFGFLFNLDYSFTFGQVIWALGWSMVVLAALVRLPLVAVGVLGAAMIACHNLLDGVDPNWLGGSWRVLHGPQGVVPLCSGTIFYVKYPLVPWVGVMLAGYALGPVVARDTSASWGVLRVSGIVLTAIYVALRAANVYGDPRPWSVRGDAVFTVMDFVNCEKYPPSLLYCP